MDNNDGNMDTNVLQCAISHYGYIALQQDQWIKESKERWKKESHPVPLNIQQEESELEITRALIGALKKQNPVEPLKHGYVDDMYYWKCPICGAEWFENHFHEYCTDCGQRFNLTCFENA